MAKKNYFKFILLFAIVISCKDTHESEYTIATQQGDVVVSLVQENKVNYLVSRYNDSTISKWPLRFPIYRFEKGDVNNDSQDDLAVGVIKSTRYDSLVRKRLFLFQIRNKSIIPLWLGSSLGHPLEDFRVRTTSDSTTVIQSIEKEKDGKYLVAEYEWFGFGLSFRNHLKREISLQRARRFLAE